MIDSLYVSPLTIYFVILVYLYTSFEMSRKLINKTQYFNEYKNNTNYGGLN